MALNYYVPTKVTSANGMQPPADVPANNTPPQAVDSGPIASEDQRDDQLIAQLLSISPLCLPLAYPTHQLIGRGELLATLRTHLLGAPEARLALEGPPGIGKTRMAIELAYDGPIRQHFRGGVLMMGLGQHPDVELHLRGWADALGLEHDPRLSIAAQVERIATRIDSRGEPCLLIVDDVWKAEHCAFLPSGPFIATLITGRQREVKRVRGVGRRGEPGHLAAARAGNSLFHAVRARWPSLKPTTTRWRRWRR